MAINLILILVCYLIGNISPSIIIARVFAKTDIRKHGSGNAGTTNVLRTLGPAAAAVTLIIDIGKGVAAVLIGRYFGGEHIGDMWIVNQDMAMACGLAVFIGHIWPVIFGFRGGKGVATGLGVILTVVPGIAWISLLVGIVVLCAFRRVSLAAILGVLALPAAAYFYDAMYVSWAVIIAVIVVIKHRQNIVRLIKGEEPKLSMRRFSKREEKDWQKK